MTCPVLYSTNTRLKFFICQKYRHDIHYIWCSEVFDKSMLSPYSYASLLPPSSNPADIYRQLQKDVHDGDLHSSKIKEQKALFSRLAVEWEAHGEISASDREEIIYMANLPTFDYWRPLLYVIPRAGVENHMKLVSIGNRAGIAEEYIIEDLKREEFDIIEI